MDEIWKEIPGKPLYQLSTEGRARKFVRGEWREYIPAYNGRYPGIAGDGLHRQVYRAHVGPIPEGMLIRHLNDIPHDNRLCNLAIGTQSDNAKDKFRNNPHLGAKKSAEMKALHTCSEYKAKHSRGASIGQTKFTSEQVNQILAEFNQMSSGKCQRYDELGTKYGVSGQLIRSIVKGKYIPKDLK